MAVFYLIRGKTIIAEIDTEDIAVIALPLLGGELKMSLLNRSHVLAMMNRLDWTAEEFIENFGLVDERE